MINRVLISFLIMFLAGCAGMGKSCFTVFGEYEGKKGSFEYCWEPKESKVNGVPTLSDKDGKEYYVISKIQVEKINQMTGNQYTQILRSRGYKLSPIGLLLWNISGHDQNKKKQEKVSEPPRSDSSKLKPKEKKVAPITKSVKKAAVKPAKKTVKAVKAKKVSKAKTK